MEDVLFGQKALCRHHQWNRMCRQKYRFDRRGRTDEKWKSKRFAAKDKVRLKQLVENDAYYQNMEEDAFDVVVQYANVTELVGVKDYRRENGRVDMCTAIREMLEDSRQEGIEAGIKEGEILLAALISCLLADNRAEDLKLAAEDEEIRKKFYREYGLID